MNRNPLADGIEELKQLPQSQVQVNGSTITLTVTNASQQGVISMVGGPALTSLTITPTLPTSSVSLINSTTSGAGGSPVGLITVPAAVVVVVIGLVLYRKRSRKAN